MTTLDPKHKRLIHECTKRVKSNYLANDLAHQIGHAHQVARDGIHIAKELSAEHLIPSIIIAAYYHDIHRHKPEIHHLLAHDEIFNDKRFIMGVSGVEEKDLKDIANACLEHRASWIGEYSSLLSEIIASADRGAPDKVTVDARVRRSYLYGRGVFNLTHYDAQVHAITYVKDRFGSFGDAAYPTVYRQVYSGLLEIQATKIDALLITDCPWNKFMAEYINNENKTRNVGDRKATGTAC